MPAQSHNKIDWALVEIVYRLGQLSNQEIGDKFGVTRKAIWEHAKRNGWQRDLSSQGTMLSQMKLSRKIGYGNGSFARAREVELPDQAIAADLTDVVVAVAVILACRKQIHQLRDLADRGMNHLADFQEVK